MKKPKNFDATVRLIASADSASVPYDGPIAMLTKVEAREQERKRKERLEEQVRERIAKAKARAAKEIDWDVIENFIGYGPIDAPVVFIGMEEGLYDPTYLEADLKYRSTFAPVMDIQEAHLGLYKGPDLFGPRARAQKTWWAASDVMLHFDGLTPKDKKHRAALRKQYRTMILGNAKLSDALLVELLPYPSPSKTDWFYGAYKFKTRQEYEAKVTDGRIRLLRSTLEQYPRKAIICYGRDDWKRFKRLFPDDTKWTIVGRFEYAMWNGAKVTLTDHLTSPCFYSDEGLDQLAAIALP